MNKNVCKGKDDVLQSCGNTDFDELVKDEFVGTLYGSSGDEELNRNPDTFTYYKPSNEYTTYYYNTDFTGKEQSTLFFDFATGINTYSVFLGKDNIVTRKRLKPAFPAYRF